ncbi:MAG: LexA family protein [Planctomycetota bacterium]
MLPTTPFAGTIYGMEKGRKGSQMRTLLFIFNYIKSNGCAPRKTEIAKALGTSATLIYHHIYCLFGEGYLRILKQGEYGRNIELTEKGILTCENSN